ncbi:MAG: phage tail family protein [Lachnospiraceae bacterium]|nr:phage tail family protein [Lachnospiraceae bacterium]
MTDIKVICTNDKDISIAFRWDVFSPFHLLDIEGIYGIESNVVTSENTTTDGSTFQGATAIQRNIILTFEMDESYKQNREILYRCFAIKRPGTMEYAESGGRKMINYIVESIIPGKIKGVIRDYAVSLICPCPYFTDLTDVRVTMASWVSNLTFPAFFPEEGIVFGYRRAEFVKAIENDSGMDGIGMTTVFYADDKVSNPAIYHAESGQFIKIGSMESPFILGAGQYAVINTHTGNKNIFLLDGISNADIEKLTDRFGVVDWNKVVSRYGVSINRFLDEDAAFIQLIDGTNTITYAADEGIDNLLVSIYYRLSYLGV